MSKGHGLRAEWRWLTIGPRNIWLYIYNPLNKP